MAQVLFSSISLNAGLSELSIYLQYIDIPTYNADMFKMVKKQGLQICTFQIMEILKYWSNRSRSNHLDRGSITIIANYLDFFFVKKS